MKDKNNICLPNFCHDCSFFNSISETGTIYECEREHMCGYLYAKFKKQILETETQNNKKDQQKQKKEVILMDKIFGFGNRPQQGWQCPICGRIMSPTTPFCPCEGQGRKTYYTTNIETQNNKNEAGVNNEAKPM